MPYIFLVLSGILFGGVVFYAKILFNAGASLFEVMLYPNIIAALGMTWFARSQIKKVFSVPLSVTITFITAMFFINIGQYAPLIMKVPVTLVVLLLYLQPLWTILIDNFYFKRKQDLETWMLVFMMIIGLVFLIDPFSNFRFSGLGITLAVLGGIGLSLWIFMTKRFSERGINAYATYWTACVYSVIPCVVLYMVLREDEGNLKFLRMSLDIPPKLWLHFIFYSLVIVTLPNILLFSNNKNIPATSIGMILLLEPVTSILLDVIFLNVALTWNILTGGAIILISNIILINHKNKTY